MSLDEKTTNGLSVWEKYVTKNKNLRGTVFRFVGNNAFGYDRITKEKIQFDASMGISIISSSKTSIAGSTCAACRVGTTVCYIPTKNIEKPSTSNPTRIERGALENLDEKIRKRGYPIDIVVLDSHKQKIQFMCRDVVACKNHPRDDKADFVLMDVNGNVALYISHKASGGASEIQQYSGVSAQSGERIKEHPLVLNFLRKVAAFMDVYPLTEALWTPIDMTTSSGKLLANLSVFGENFDKQFSYNGVHLVASGSPVFRSPRVFSVGTTTIENRKNDVVVLDWEGKVVCNGEIEKLDGDYAPCLFARPQSGRSFTIDGKTYNNVRVMIAPIGIVKNRTARKI